jgi:AcrR family transcriptional regulator
MERKRAQARADLVRAATEVIADNGTHAFSIREVTRRCDVGLGTFYSHFESREALINEVVQLTIAEIADEVLAQSASLADPEEAVCAGIRQLVRRSLEDPEFARLLVSLDRGERRFEELLWPASRALISRGIDQGRFDVPNPDLALQMAIAGTFRVIASVTEGPADPSVEKDCAYGVLRSFGLEAEHAREVVRRPLPVPFQVRASRHAPTG